MQRPVETFKLELPYKRTLGPVIGAFFTALRDGRIVGSRTLTSRTGTPKYISTSWIWKGFWGFCVTSGSSWDRVFARA